MTDPHEQIVAPGATESARDVYDRFRDSDRAELRRARKALGEPVFGLIAKGETE
jgi:hypothetical protein